MLYLYNTKLNIFLYVIAQNQLYFFMLHLKFNCISLHYGVFK